MRRLLTLFMIFIATHASGANAPTVMVFGDSLSAGYGVDVDQSWASLLQARLTSQGYEHRVVNASISGETTEGGVSRIATALKNFAPELVILELGGNDGLRGFPTSRMKENLAAIIETSQQSGAAVVFGRISHPRNNRTRDNRSIEKVYRGRWGE
jgi:acyl-CoA thioesterase-1